MADDKNLKNVFSQLDSLLGSADIKDVTAESTGFTTLPEGYYLCEVVAANLGLGKTSKEPQVAMRFKIVEDGVNYESDSKNKIYEVTRKGTKNRLIFKYYPLRDEEFVRRFVSDMLKFEGDEPGVPLLGKEYFTNSDLIEDALEVLKGMRIYIHNTVTEKDDGTSSTWANVLSWKNANGLGLK